jgi:outer membrane protein assembly factor BamD
MNRQLILKTTGVVLVLLLVGCKGSGRKEDPILRLSGAESLKQGKELLDDKKYSRARPYLNHAFEVEPNSASGREALLLVADSYYKDGGIENYVRAEARYRDFLNRFPTSDKAPYAQFQIANSRAERAAPPDRDQSPTRKALAAYQDLLRLYPTSPYADKAHEKMEQVQNTLAEHEWKVGHFYYRFRLYSAAVDRFEYLVDHYPDYPATDRILFFLGQAQLKTKHPDEARQAFARLRKAYPKSEYVTKIPKVPPKASDDQEAQKG